MSDSTPPAGPPARRRRVLAVALLVLMFVAGLYGGMRLGQATGAEVRDLSRQVEVLAREMDSGAPPPISSLDVPGALAPLLSRDAAEREARVLQFAERGDRRIVSPLIAVGHTGHLSAIAQAEVPANRFVDTIPELTEGERAALRELTGQDFGDDWWGWQQWWWTQADAPEHPGFALFQVRMYGGIDPTFVDLLDPGHPCTIRRDEIQWGGVRFDAIPALTGPSILRADAPEAALFRDDEPVFGVAFDGEARAYPLRIVDWHEMVNDNVGGRRIALSYCTLCGAAVCYDAEVPGIGRLVFGSSGFLRRSNKLMYDRQTRTLWSAIEGVPVLGLLAAREPAIVLRRLPVVRTTWGAWRRRHRDTTILSPETGYQRRYEPGAAYGDYFASPDTYFPVAPRSDALATKEWVFGVRADGRSKAYPVRLFEDRGIVHDTFAGKSLVIVGNATTLEVRAYEAGAMTFEMIDCTPSLQAVAAADTGERFEVREDALVGANGRRLPRVAGHLAYWFGWYAAFPDTQLHTAGSP